MHPGNAAFAVNTYSYTLRGSARAAVQALAGRGFREFELMMYPGHLWPDEVDAAQRRDWRAWAEGEGLTIRTLNMPNVDLNIAAATAEMRAMTLGLLRRFVVLAGDIGAQGVVLGPGKANPLLPMPHEQMVAHFHAALDELVPLAARHGTAIFVENMPFAFLPRAAELLEAVEASAHPDLGIVYDVANGHFVHEDPAAGLRRCAGRLQVVHLSDTTQASFRHDAVGLGTVDFTAIPGVLQSIGFKRRPVLEIIDPDPDRAIDQSARRLEAAGWT
ncbi:MAG: sugar phosphate isomerase/epimerase [Piscinibacter sp.]|uniref:sugar phosphate isomerase/epimerase family protein n=1 Tax=Piscinibacter sp. TaxID=1903157 RepID=UPI00258C43F0|nr:sugar phosphate isomerase/epimerase family protein [Piscinibacter sp.]MCW5666275.1 sugar phosphate isomerase/epimerase [Piscinibacter sp.]